MSDANSRHNTLIIAMVIGFFCIALIGGGALAALFLVRAPQAERAPHIVPPSELEMNAVSGALQVEGEDGYRPTSQYVEPGADKDEVTLGFEAGEQEGGGGARRLDDEEVQEAVYANQNELIGCYARGLEQNEDLSGRVDFHFRIAGDGHVAMVKVTRSELQDHATEDCFVKKAKQWHFPQTRSEQLVRFDTNFTFAY